MLDNRLVIAAREGETKDVILLLNDMYKDSKDNMCEGMYLALLWSAIGDQIDTLNALIDIGADVNFVSYRGHRILSSAVFEGNFNVVKFLLEKGADINAKDTCGKTALHYAINKKSTIDLITLLLEKGADPKIEDESGRTALDYAKLYSTKKEIYNTFVDVIKERV